MKPCTWRIWLMLILGLTVPRFAAAQDLIICTEENPPVSFLEQGRLTGSSVAVVREILRRLDRSDPIRLVPWARGYGMLQSQPDVVLFSTARTPERENQFFWVGPLFRAKGGFYALKSRNLRFNSLDEVKRVGAIATYKDDAREQILKTHGFANLDSSNSPVSNLKKLMAGRVDLWFYSDLGMRQIAQQAGVDPSQLSLVYVYKSYDAYIAMSRQMPGAVVHRWQRALDGMVRDGTFKRLSLKWLDPVNLPTSAAPEPAADPKVALTLLTEDNPPGNYLKNGRPAGFVVDIVAQLLLRLKRSDPIRVVPWARGYNQALTQPNTVLFSTTRLPYRETLFHWVGPVYTQRWGFYAVRTSNMRIDSLDAARAVRAIGTYHNDAKEQYLMRRGFANLISANKNTSNVRHLMQGRIDLWVSSDLNMPHIARQAGVDPDRLTCLLAFKSVDNYIAFSLSTSEKTVAAWQTALDALKADGSYDAILRRHLDASEP